MSSVLLDLGFITHAKITLKVTIRQYVNNIKLTGDQSSKRYVDT